jgi:hypothetical protein
VSEDGLLATGPSFGRPWLADRRARRITSGCDIRGHRESDSRLLEQPVEELFAGVYEGLHGRGEVSGVGGIHCGETLLHRDAPSVSSARMKGVLRYTGSAKTLRAMTRGEI